MITTCSPDRVGTSQALVFDGPMVDAMFQVDDCRRIHHDGAAVMRTVWCPDSPPIDFENCGATIRAIMQAWAPSFVREFSEPGPKVMTILGCVLAYRPVQSEICVPVFAARTLNATGQCRVTLSRR